MARMCCLVGVVHNRTLFVANLGDSQAVLGKVGRTGHIAAEQLCSEHNANQGAARQELVVQHPDDPHIVALKPGVWRVRGLIQVSRSIGNVYLKHAKYNNERIKPKFRLSESFARPILSADPSIISRTIQPSDSFIIFASDGLWEHLSNQDAVEIVHSHQRAESALTVTCHSSSTPTGLRQSIGRQWRIVWKLEDLEQAMSNPNPMKAIASRVAAGQKAAEGMPRAASFTSSQMATLSNGFDSSIMSTAATTGSTGSIVTDLGVVGRGVKRANIKPISAEPARKNL